MAVKPTKLGMTIRGEKKKEEWYDRQERAMKELGDEVFEPIKEKIKGTMKKVPQATPQYPSRAKRSRT